MVKDHKRPVFHQATEAPKPTFEPHHVGAEDENEGVGVELSVPAPEKILEPVEADDIISEHVEKLEEIVHETLPHGWKVLTEAQQDGAHYLVTGDFESEGIRAFWRKTRVLSHSRWILYGKWSESLSRADVMPIPRYFKDLPK